MQVPIAILCHLITTQDTGQLKYYGWMERASNTSTWDVWRFTEKSNTVTGRSGNSIIKSHLNIKEMGFFLD
jgi:hypothetical protein